MNGQVNGRLTTAIGRIDADGGTATNLGMEMAAKVLENNPVQSGEKRNQVVVVFTDGVPGIFTDDRDSTRTNSYANPAIYTAKTLKDKGVSVYTVGVFAGADAGASFSTTSTDWDDDDTANRFMQYLSSNYPNAESMTNGGAKANDGFYLSAADSTALADIFDQIAENIQHGSANVQLDANAIVKDVLTGPYQFNTGVTSNDIKVYTVPATNIADDGQITWGSRQPLNGAQVSLNGKTVTVSGFDYANNFISADGYAEGDPSAEGNYHGRKLVVEITVKPDYSQTIGGNYIASNTDQSGVYENSTTQEATGKFNIPASDIDIQYDFTVENQTIYITNSANLEDLFTEGTLANGTNNAYADITYTVTTTDSEGGTVTVGTYTIPHGSSTGYWTEGGSNMVTPTDCTQYTITCEVSSCYDPSTMDGVPTGADEYSGTKTATVHVMIPKVSVTDTTINLGDSANLANNLTSYPGSSSGNTDDWVDKNTHDEFPEPTGTEPKVTVKWNWVAGSDALFEDSTTGEFSTQIPLTEDTDFTISVYVGDPQEPLASENVSLTENVIAHTEDCINKIDTPDHHFTVHVKSVDGRLVIQKKVTEFAKNGNAVFDFKVTDSAGVSTYYQVEVGETDIATQVASILLKAGTYTVTELDNMNYTYEGATVMVQGGEAENKQVKEFTVTVELNKTTIVTFKNKGKTQNIPTDNSGVKNNYDEVGGNGVVIWKEPEELGNDSNDNITGGE